MLPYVVEVPEDGDYSLLLTGDSTAGNITMYGCGMKSESQYFFLSNDQPEHRVLPTGTYAVRAEVPDVAPAANLQLTIRRLPPAP